MIEGIVDVWGMNEKGGGEGEMMEGGEKKGVEMGKDLM